MKDYKKELYYEDVDVGDVFETASRTITEADIMQFAGLTGDYNELHTSDMYAKQTPNKERIAHGMLTMAIANGLYMRMGYFHSVLLEIKNWRWLRPVRISDSIWVRLILEEKRLTKSLVKGIFTWKYEVLNQNDEMVAEGCMIRMIDNPSGSEETAGV